MVFCYTFNGYHLEKICFDEIYWSSAIKNLTWFWHNELAPYLLYNKDDKNDTISFKKVSYFILNDKEQSISQNVASTTIEVGFSKNKTLKRKSTHIKKKSKKSGELVYLCDICHQNFQENPDQFEKNSIECDKCKRWFRFGFVKISSAEDIPKANINWSGYICHELLKILQIN